MRVSRATIRYWNKQRAAKRVIKPTPGPWTVSDNTATPYGQLMVESENHGAVALCYTVERGETAAPSESVANARLISAAPDLLELARQVVLAADQNEGDIPADIVRGARAAIDKATGV